MNHCLFWGEKSPKGNTGSLFGENRFLRKNSPSFSPNCFGGACGHNCLLLTGPLQKCHQLGRNVCFCREHVTPGALPCYLSFYLLELSMSQFVIRFSKLVLCVTLVRNVY